MIQQISRRLMKWREAQGKVVSPSAASEKHLPYFELLAALQGAQDGCPFCQASAQAALISSPGLCLAHLLQAAGYMDEECKVSALLEIHRTRLRLLRADLCEFIRKQDYRFKDELLTTSSNSPRSLTWQAGSSPISLRKL